MKIFFLKSIKILFQIINILFVILSIVLVLISIFKKEWMIAFIEWMKITINSLWSWNYIIAWLSSTIESFPVLWVLVPGQNILLAVGWFFWNISFVHLIYIMWIASLWAILWNLFGYILGKIYGDIFFKKYGIWFWIGVTEVKYLKKGINTWWALWIVLWKFHPITRSFLPFIAGSMWMSSMKFMFYNVVGSIIRAITIILLWVVFVEYYEPIIEYSGTIMIVILSILAVYIYKFKKQEFLKYIQEKNQEMDELTKKK